MNTIPVVLAAELLARGMRTRIIDQGDAVALQARRCLIDRAA
jgi:hypothetical protein